MHILWIYIFFASQSFPPIQNILSTLSSMMYVLHSVPLLSSYAYQIKFRPDFPFYEWSGVYPCNAQSYDFKANKNSCCECKTDDFPDPQSIKPVWFKVITTQSNKSVLITLKSCIIITNKLLCDLSFACLSNKVMKMEEGKIESGTKRKICHINLSESPSLVIKVGHFKWSRPIVINTTHNEADIFELSLPGRKQAIKLYLSMNTRINMRSGSTIEIEIFSKAAVIDRTNLNLFIASKLNPGVSLVRSTCSNLSIGHHHAGSTSTSSSSPSSVLPSPLHEKADEHAYKSDANKNSLNATVAATPDASISSSHHSFADDLSSNAGTANDASRLHDDDGRLNQKASTVLPEILITNVEVHSSNKYELHYATLGHYVYTGSNGVRWCYLPHSCHGGLQLRTPSEDKLQRSNRLIRFTTKVSCMVLVLVDIKVELKWLVTEGYHKVMELATAKGVVKGIMEECFYAIYGKIYDVSSRVVLKASWNKHGANMYSVFILPAHLPSQLDHNSLFHTHHPSDGGSSASSASNDMVDSSNSRNNNNSDIALSKISLYQQIIYKDAFTRDILTRCWTEGSNQLSLIYSYDNVINVGVCKGKVWSEELNMELLLNTHTKGSFEVPNSISQICYQLSYSIQNLPGLYNETQLMTFMPRYCVLNCMEETILISQKGSEKYLQFYPYKPEGWHKLELDSGTEVQFRIASTVWSLGAIDINEIGTSLLYLPIRSHGLAVSSFGIVIHVEVKLADPSDHCSIIIIIWEETIESRASMSICNNSDVTITVRQADIEIDHDIKDQEQLFEIILHPGKSLPFGWSDPTSSHNILVAVGEGLKGQNKRIASINMLKTDQSLRLPYVNKSQRGKGSSKSEVVLSTRMNHHSHMLEISNINKFNYSKILTVDTSSKSIKINDEHEEEKANSNLKCYGFDFVLSSFGVSLVVEKPIRREFFSLYVDLLEVLLRVRGNMRSLELMVMDLQVDNYCETVIYPVLLRSRKKQIHQSVLLEGEKKNNIGTSNRSKDFMLLDKNINVKSSTSTRDGVKSPLSSSSSLSQQQRQSNQGDEESEVPFIQLTIVQETQRDGTPPVFKYVAFRILSLALEVDSSTVYLLYEDLLNGLKVLDRSQALAISFPNRWLDEFNKSQLYPQQQLRVINVYKSKIHAQQSKMYFHYLVIHPIKVVLTIIQTTYPRLKKKKYQSNVVTQLERLSVIGIEKLQLKLRSFEVEDAMESISSLRDIVINLIKSDIQSQLAEIAGSITMIGSPIGFARKVGSGVKAFFYEPYLGAVHGSNHFFIGLGRGTSHLFSNVVTGAMDSAAAIVGTATKGMSYISGDNEYIRKRAMKRQQRLANRGGFFDGVRDGTDSLVSGITSGVTGLVLKPIEEASKSGVSGFIKGLGLGIIGVAVKPMIGFSDGIASVAQGISNAVDINARTSHVRPPRALQPSVLDPSVLIVVPLNMEAAYAQEFVINRAKRGHYDDAFLCYIPLNNEGEEIILSSIYIYWRRNQSLWGRMWANISHCVYMENYVGIMLYTGGTNGGACLVLIPCPSKAICRHVYGALAANSNRMGNPANVIPLDVLDSFYNSTSQSNKNIKDSNTKSNYNSNSKNKMNNNTDDDSDLIFRVQEERLVQIKDASLLGTIDGYRFGTSNGKELKRITGSEHDILMRACFHLENSLTSWQVVDQRIWSLIWEWGCINPSSRCCVTAIINRSDSPIQITRVQMVIGKNVLIIGSKATGYEVESRCLLPEGMVIVFISAFPESALSIDTGHLKANVNTAAFSAVIASTQRESFCEGKGGFTVGFLEKTVCEWWSKYVIVIS